MSEMDLSVLAQQMRDAAQCLALAADQCLLADQDWVQTARGFLLNRSAALDVDARIAAADEALAEELAEQLKELDPNGSTFGNGYMPAARKLIEVEAGWHK
jgi:hypothetical protein